MSKQKKVDATLAAHSLEIAKLMNDVRELKSECQDLSERIKTLQGKMEQYRSRTPKPHV